MKIVPNKDRVVLYLKEDEFNENGMVIPDELKPTKMMAFVKAVGSDVTGYSVGDEAILPDIYGEIEIEDEKIIILYEKDILGKVVR